MNKFEYKHVYVSDEEVPSTVDILNIAGAERWEFTGRAVDTGYGTEYLMKRVVDEHL